MILDKLEDVIIGEGDRQTFFHLGYKCLIKRCMESGALCGYVGVSDKSKLFGVNYDDVYDLIPDLSVHGGLTYSGFWKKEENDSFYYLGFDAAHAGDIMPFMRFNFRIMMSIDRKAVYRDMNYMASECRLLAEQIKRFDDKTLSKS